MKQQLQAKYGFTSGDVLELKEDASDEDWKTALAHPDKYPTLKAGTKVVFKEYYINFYGCWAQVTHGETRYYLKLSVLTK